MSVRTRRIRDGKPTEVAVTKVLPGDLVALAAGDLIPPDKPGPETQDLFVKQALLTGEPYPTDMILLDQDLHGLADGALEGRRTFDNITRLVCRRRAGLGRGFRPAVALTDWSPRLQPWIGGPRLKPWTPNELAGTMIKAAGPLGCLPPRPHRRC